MTFCFVQFLWSNWKLCTMITSIVSIPVIISMLLLLLRAYLHTNVSIYPKSTPGLKYSLTELPAWPKTLKPCFYPPILC